MLAFAFGIGAIAAMVCYVIHHDSEDKKAERRAQNLLQSILTWAQCMQLQICEYVEEQSRLTPGRIYRVYRSPSVIVVVYDGDSLAGHLCIVPVISLPVSDQVAAHVLMIRGNEAEYVRTAGFHRYSEPLAC